MKFDLNLKNIGKGFDNVSKTLATSTLFWVLLLFL